MEGAVPKKTGTSVKKNSSVKSESETQTAVAVRVPSFKIKGPPETVSAAEKMVTPESIQTASMARKRRMITKKAQGVRTREKTPEPSRTSIPHEDTTTTDDEDSRSSKVTGETEADDIYAEMRKKIEQKVKERDHDDLDIDAIREQQVVEAKERRRRSISPFALPTKEEIEALQLKRKGSYIDPGNKLLTTPPSYPVTFKDEFDPLIRKNSLIAANADRFRGESISVKSNPPSPVHKHAFQLSTPTTPTKVPNVHAPEKLVKTHSFTNVPYRDNSPKVVPIKPDPLTMQPSKSNLKTNASFGKNDHDFQNYPPSNEGPPVRPKRSKSGTRSQVNALSSKCVIL